MPDVGGRQERELHFYDSAVSITRLKASLFDNSRSRFVGMAGGVAEGRENRGRVDGKRRRKLGGRGEEEEESRRGREEGKGAGECHEGGETPYRQSLV